MNHPQRRASDRKRFWKRWQTIVGTILSTLALIGIIWAKAIQPEINGMIDKKQEPIYDALEYNNCLHMAFMTEEQLAKATQLYKQSRLCRGKLGKK
jgi:hypothetical protein